MNSEKKRPTTISIIGWTYLALSILMFFSAIMGYFTFTIMESQMEEFGEFPPDTPDQFDFIWKLFPYFGTLSLAQMALSAFILICSIEFLKLRKWALYAIETISWLAILSHVVGGVFWVYGWLNMFNTIPDELSGGMQSLFRIGGAMMGAFVIVVFTVPFILVVRYLRSLAARNAFSGST